MATFLSALIRKARDPGPVPFPHQATLLLDNPFRRMINKPIDVIDSLDLDGSERVLELGPGPGYFSVEIARRLPHGRLALFDIQPEMLDKARRRLQRSGFGDVGYTVGQAAAGLPFADSTFDVAFLAAVIGEVPDQQNCLRSLRRVLRPRGRLVLAEMFSDPDRLSVRELRDLAEPAGFEFVAAGGNRWQDLVSFRSSAVPQ